MATFISTIKFTQKGIEGISDTVKRANAFKTAAKKLGVKVIDCYWTMGYFDGVIVLEAPNDESATAAMLHLAGQGFVHTTTARAFKSDEIGKVVGMLAK